MKDQNLIKYMKALGVDVTPEDIDMIKKSVEIDAHEDRKTDADRANEWWARQCDKGVLCFANFGHYHYLRLGMTDIIKLYNLHK